MPHPQISTTGGFESAATGGRIFTMEKTREYQGPPKVDFEAAAAATDRFPPPADEEMCKRWAVLTSIFHPTETVRQLAGLSDWCVVVVGDENGPADYNVEGVKYLSPGDQEQLPYRIVQLLPWSHFGRKNIGYMYAIHHGAEVIYDVDDDNALIHPDEGVPFAGISVEPSSAVSGLKLPHFSVDPSTSVHNPYGCFGAPDIVWPRGFPLDKIHDPGSSVCDTESTGDVDSRTVVGVVQALANHDPDVDAIYRLTYPTGGLPFDFVAPTTLESANLLRGVPASAFTPYNAQATIHFPVAFWGLLLPVTVHGRVSDIWRGFFTQTLLPLAGATIAFAPAWVEQVRNAHDYLADFQAELPLYEKSGALVEFLLGYSRAIEQEGLTPSRVEDLYITMFEYGIIEESDVQLIQVWLQDLQAVGYDFQEHATMNSRMETEAGEATSQELATTEKENSTGPREDVLLVIAIVSGRPERRAALRDTWFAWKDERVKIRFFTENPAGWSRKERKARAALRAEAETYGDVVILDINPGMNFAVKLLEAMRWMSAEFSFDFFLRLDDDYFLCLRRLLDELESTKASIAVAKKPLQIYAGFLQCSKDYTRIDEAYMLLTGEIVSRAVAALPDLRCGGHAGLTSGYWLAKGHVLNPLGDVTWVWDRRLDHTGKLVKGPVEEYASVCLTHIGIHKTYPEQMHPLWDAAKDIAGPGFNRTDLEGSYVQDYIHDTPRCKHWEGGVTEDSFKNADHSQLCASFEAGSTKKYCGGQGCHGVV